MKQPISRRYPAGSWHTFRLLSRLFEVLFSFWLGGLHSGSQRFGRCRWLRLWWRWWLWCVFWCHYTDQTDYPYLLSTSSNSIVNVKIDAGCMRANKTINPYHIFQCKVNYYRLPWQPWWDARSRVVAASTSVLDWPTRWYRLGVWMLQIYYNHFQPWHHPVNLIGSENTFFSINYNTL